MTADAADPLPPSPEPTPSREAAREEGQPIVARAGRYYRTMRFIMVAAVLGAAVWFARDGWVKYPERNARIDDVTRRLNATTSETEKAKLDAEMRELGTRKEPFDIYLQKVIAVCLPIVGLAYLGFFLYRSRGAIVLNGDVLSVPGHPPISIGELRSIDNRLWKKKGIARLTYDSAGRERVITLDDFVYDQTPVDDIYAVISARHNVSDDAAGQHAVGSSHTPAAGNRAKA